MTNLHTNTARPLAAPARPAGGGATLNPFVVVEGAVEFIDFVVGVLGGHEVVDARTALPDGRLIHAEVTLGDAHLLIVDRLDGWPATRGCCRSGSTMSQRPSPTRSLEAQGS